jgi:hypothetical protein
MLTSISPSSSRTGRPMPDHIPRDPQGFEDIDAFFDSPERDESTRSGLTSAVTEGDTRRTIATTIAASSVRTDFQASGRTTVAGSKRILSMMADDDDDDEEDGQGNQTAGDIIDQEEGVNFGDDSGSRSMDIVTPSKCEWSSSGCFDREWVTHTIPLQPSLGQNVIVSSDQTRRSSIFDKLPHFRTATFYFPWSDTVFESITRARRGRLPRGPRLESTDKRPPSPSRRCSARLS